MTTADDARPRILLIDGNERNVSLLSDFLKQEGYEPIGITEIEDAEKRTSGPVQAVFAIIDIDRFEQSMWRYCERLHDEGVPFVVLSGIESATLQQESQERGAQAFVDKPTSKQQLRNLIEKTVSINST